MSMKGTLSLSINSKGASVRSVKGGGKASTPELMGRRNFLRRIGLTGAIAAGLVGVADVAGVSPTMAAQRGTNRTSDAPATCCWNCVFTHCGCNGCCPAGYCCYVCTTSKGTCSSYNQCCPRTNNCGDFSHCGGGPCS